MLSKFLLVLCFFCMGSCPAIFAQIVGLNPACESFLELHPEHYIFPQNLFVSTSYQGAPFFKARQNTWGLSLKGAIKTYKFVEYNSENKTDTLDIEHWNKQGLLIVARGRNTYLANGWDSFVYNEQKQYLKSFHYYPQDSLKKDTCILYYQYNEQQLLARIYTDFPKQYQPQSSSHYWEHSYDSLSLFWEYKYDSLGRLIEENQFLTTNKPDLIYKLDTILLENLQLQYIQDSACILKQKAWAFVMKNTETKSKKAHYKQHSYYKICKNIHKQAIYIDDNITQDTLYYQDNLLKKQCSDDVTTFFRYANGLLKSFYFKSNVMFFKKQIYYNAQKLPIKTKSSYPVITDANKQIIGVFIDLYKYDKMGNIVEFIHIDNAKKQLKKICIIEYYP